VRLWSPGRPQSRPRRGAVLAALLALGVCRATAALGDDATARAKVARRKALFIEQFTRLVEWPRDSLPPAGPFVVCALGNSDTADELAAVASSVRFKQRPCQLRRPRIGELGGCHVLYLAASAAPRLAQALASVADRPVLTVSDTPGFAERGVQFNLFEEARSAPQPGLYVGFELNVEAVRRSVLVFDPQLLSAGRRVEGESP
jgi:hypothetical protein